MRVFGDFEVMQVIVEQVRRSAMGDEKSEWRDDVQRRKQMDQQRKCEV